MLLNELCYFFEKERYFLKFDENYNFKILISDGLTKEKGKS